jgi:hypothetical protein
MSGVWHGGKGSGSRPKCISQEEYDNRWDNIFGRDKPEEDNTGTSKDEFYDVLTTEDALRSNVETQEAINTQNKNGSGSA